MLNFAIAGDRYLPECTIITEFVRLYSVCVNDTDRRFKAFFGERAAAKEKFSAILKTALSGTPDDAVLKDPNLCLYLNEWRELFPNDRAVIIIRDPRDVVSSMLQVLRKTNPGAKVRQAIDAVAPHFFEIDRADLQTDKILTVRYEDIVSSKRGTINVLSGFLGRPLSTMHQSSYKFDQSDPFFSNLYGKPVVSERIGCYKTQLTQVELREVVNVYSGIISRYFPDL